jgi:hypothetical protein
LTIELTAVEPIGCAFTRLVYATQALDGATIEQLKRRAESLEQRLSYLLERVRPIEMDEDACVVQMRSNPPARDDDGTKYYELVVERGALRLCRYARRAGQQRVVVPAELTHEVVVRLARDFEQAARA